MNYLSQKAQNIAPYQPGEQPQNENLIKINTNENPYPPSPRVLARIKQCAETDFRLYPDPDSNKLKTALARRENLEADQVFCSNGSDEVLAFCYPAFFDTNNPILFPDITYSFYPVYANLFSINYREIPLDAQFRLRPQDYLIENGGIIIANPNAPTGMFLSLDQLELIIKYNLGRAVVIVDEAYVEFGGQTAAPLIKDYDNLLIIRTLSKSHSLAGLRIGYALGNAGLISGLQRIKNAFNSYPVDNLAQAGAIAAIEDENYTREILNKITATRDRITNELQALGFVIPESRSNFIFITHPRFRAADIFTYLRANGVLVRYFNKPRLENYLRVSIGTGEQMDIVLKVIEEFIRLA